MRTSTLITAILTIAYTCRGVTIAASESSIPTTAVGRRCLVNYDCDRTREYCDKRYRVCRELDGALGSRCATNSDCPLGSFCSGTDGTCTTDIYTCEKDEREDHQCNDRRYDATSRSCVHSKQNMPCRDDCLAEPYCRDGYCVGDQHASQPQREACRSLIQNLAGGRLYTRREMPRLQDAAIRNPLLEDPTSPATSAQPPTSPPAPPAETSTQPPTSPAAPPASTSQPVAPSQMAGPSRSSTLSPSPSHTRTPSRTPTPSTSTAAFGELIPLLNCVVPPSGAGQPFTAYLGYDNNDAMSLMFGVGFTDVNYFIPGDQDRGQPTTFLVGEHDYVFNVTSTVSLSWVLNSNLGGAPNSVTITASGPECPSCGTTPPFDIPCPSNGQCSSVMCIDGACVDTPLDGTSCDDGDICTANDTCSIVAMDMATCSGTPIPDCCLNDSDCDDMDACTNDTCDTGSFTCVHDLLPSCVSPSPSSIPSTTSSPTSSVSTTPVPSSTRTASVSTTPEPSSSATPSSSVVVAASTTPTSTATATASQSPMPSSSSTAAPSQSPAPSSSATASTSHSSSTTATPTPVPSRSATPSASVSSTPSVCGDGVVEGDEECDDGIYNNDIATCTTDCRIVRDDTGSCDTTTDTDMRRLARLLDLQMAKAYAYEFGGMVLRSTIDLMMTAGSWNDSDGDARSCPGGSDPTDYCLTKYGGCAAGTPSNLTFDVDDITDGLLTSSLGTDAFGCCDMERCRAMVSLQVDEPHRMTDQDLLDVANNMTISSYVLASVALNSGGLKTCLGISDENATEAAAIARQLGCCATALYQIVAELCYAPRHTSPGESPFDWGLDVGNPRITTRVQGSSVESDFNMRERLDEDYAPDHDANDLVTMLRQTCVYYATDVRVTSDDVIVLSCATLYHPVARGGGYPTQVLWAIDERIDTNRFPDLTPRVECLTFDDLSPTPINKILPEFDFFGSSLVGTKGSVAIYRHMKRPYTPADVGVVRAECYITSSLSTPTTTHPFAMCSPNINFRDLDLVPDTRRNLMSSDEESESYPNTFSNDLPTAYNTYDLVIYASPYHPYATTFARTDVSSGMPQMRIYLKNTSCRQNIDDVDIDPDYVDSSYRPYAFTTRGILCGWPLEGVPLALPNGADGQCVFGQSTGHRCTEDVTECPLSICLVDQGSCLNDDARPCTRTSQCPFGLSCYKEAGSYPLSKLYFACHQLGCYDSRALVSCDGCNDATVINWEDNPDGSSSGNSTDLSRVLWLFRYTDYLPEPR